MFFMFVRPTVRPFFEYQFSLLFHMSIKQIHASPLRAQISNTFKKQQLNCTFITSFIQLNNFFETKIYLFRYKL